MDSKYWLRLESGRCNSILTEAYNTVKKEKHEWIENIQHLLLQMAVEIFGIVCYILQIINLYAESR